MRSDTNDLGAMQFFGNYFVQKLWLETTMAWLGKVPEGLVTAKVTKG